MKRVIIATITFVLFLTFSSIAQWSNLGAGLNGKVNCVIEFNGSLYAGGSFTASGSTSVNNIAKFNGSSWSAVGSGLSGEVKCLAIYQNALYAGGTFSSSGSTPVSNIAKLNGNAWVAVGNGFNQIVNSLYVFNGVLYAGGGFTTSGSLTINRISKLGTTGQWENVTTSGNLIPGVVNTMINHEGVLYVGGSWSQPAIMKLEGGQWNSIGSTGTGPDGAVYSLASFQYQSSIVKKLWIGGNFQQPSQGLCTYDAANNSFGTSFNQLPSSSKVFALLSTYSNLYAGGDFTATINSQSVIDLMKKSYNTPWDTVSGLFNSSSSSILYCTGTYGGRLVVGGAFNTINGSSTFNNIAIRSTTVDIEDNIQVINTRFYPNPMMDRSVFELETRETLVQPAVQIYDASGRLVRSLETDMEINGNQLRVIVLRDQLTAGYYLLSVSDNGRPVYAERFLVR